MAESRGFQVHNSGVNSPTVTVRDIERERLFAYLVQHLRVEVPDPFAGDRFDAGSFAGPVHEPKFSFGCGWAEPTFNLTQTSNIPIVGLNPSIEPFPAMSTAPGIPLGNIGVM